ncbi:MAG TPA: excinuclease ABC subunit UvrC [Pyrinomonadaceae bacterium]|nr:excinuclease ABC subunit UvrC [Pyrinomonadaceae bacterium]
MTLEEKLKNLPVSPGVYLHKDEAGKIIYVGKAKNLRNRVRSYFQSGRGHDRKTRELVKRISDLEFIVTDTEVEALVLESNLIKQHRPRYNVLLKDDKQYPHLKLTVGEPFPRVMITRRIQRDGALYFGPFLPASLARRTIDLINRTFQLRTCDIEIDGRLPRPCLEYHIKRCLGPCVKGLCTPEEYAESVRDVRMFLEGKNKELAADYERRMVTASEEMRFEQAAKYRDLRKTVLAVSEQQKMAVTADLDVDIFGFHREGPRLALQLFTMREGKVVGRREFFWEDLPEDDSFDSAAFFSEVLVQYYSTDYVPREVHVPVDFEDRELLEKALGERKGRRVRILDPQRGQKREMIELVEKNAKLAFEQRFRVLKPDMERVLEELQETLELPRFPARVESFDVSNISGAENVAAVVVCENGKINRAEKRNFRIKTVEGANDPASMAEAVMRRYRRQLEERNPLPDLVLIDGGKTQLGAAAAAMRELGLEAVPMVGVVKPPRRHNEVSHLLVKGREHEPVYIDSHSAVLRLIQMIRDETHRAAVTYHRKRRELRDFTSELTAIPGVGEKRKNRLLRNLGSISKIAEASAEQLSPFVGHKTAGEIVEHFRRQRALAGGANDTEADTIDAPAPAGAAAATGATVTVGAADVPAAEAPLPGEVPLVEANDSNDPTVMTEETIGGEHVETRLVDPEGDAEDLQPIRSVDQFGNLLARRKSRRKRGERTTNPHGVKREKLSREDENDGDAPEEEGAIV